jgi:hypothetical protein
MALIKFFSSLSFVFLTYIGFAQNSNLRLEIIEVYEFPVIKEGDPGTEDNKYGFEGGRVIKYKGNYHLFTAERFGDPQLVKMRLAH